MTAESLQKARIAVNFRIDVWDPKTAEWMPKNYELPAKFAALAEQVLGNNKVALRVTYGGKVRYITTDQPAVNQLMGDKHGI